MNEWMNTKTNKLIIDSFINSKPQEANRGKRSSATPESSAREPRNSTVAKTHRANEEKGPRNQKGRTQKRSKKCEQTLGQLNHLFEIGIEDSKQSKSASEFLEEQVPNFIWEEHLAF